MRQGESHHQQAAQQRKDPESPPRAFAAAQYLPYVQTLIDGLEADCAAQGMEFNWFNTVDGVIFLDYVEDTALAHFGVTAKDGTQLYKDFDMQVYYSRYLDQKG